MNKEELDSLVKEYATERKLDPNKCIPIPKEELIINTKYNGICRNSYSAVWKGNHFEYTRFKFGSSFIDTINHYEDDDGYDLFIPIKQL